MIEIGEWLDANKGAIYDTEPLHLDLGEGAFAVERNGTVYVLVTTDGPDVINLPWKITSAADLATGNALDTQGTRLFPPAQRRLPCALACTVEGRTTR